MKRIALYLVLCTTILATLLTGYAGVGRARLVVEREAIARVHEMLTAMAHGGTFTGSVLIAQDSRVLLSQGYGRAAGTPCMGRKPYVRVDSPRRFCRAGPLQVNRGIGRRASLPASPLSPGRDGALPTLPSTEAVMPCSRADTMATPSQRRTHRPGAAPGNAWSRSRPEPRSAGTRRLAGWSSGSEVEGYESGGRLTRTWRRQQSGREVL
jgi:hypothetical protein